MRHDSEEPNDQVLRDRVIKWFRHYLTLRGLKQRELAQLLGIKESTMSTCLNKKSGPSLYTFVRLHFLSGYSMEDMVRHDPKAATQPHEPTPTVVGHKRSPG